MKSNPYIPGKSREQETITHSIHNMDISNKLVKTGPCQKINAMRLNHSICILNI